MIFPLRSVRAEGAFIIAVVGGGRAAGVAGGGQVGWLGRGHPPSRKIFFFRGADQSKCQSGLPPKKEAFSISWGSVPWRAEKSVHKSMNVHLHCRGEPKSQCINLECTAAVPFTYLFDSFAKRSASEKKLWYARLIDS